VRLEKKGYGQSHRNQTRRSSSDLALWWSEKNGMEGGKKKIVGDILGKNKRGHEKTDSEKGKGNNPVNQFFRGEGPNTVHYHCAAELRVKIGPVPHQTLLRRVEGGGPTRRKGEETG